MEAVAVIGIVVCLIFVYWAAEADKNSPEIKAHNSRLDSYIAMRHRRYTNVTRKKKARTVKHSVPGTYGGLGNGGGVTKKP